MTIKKLLIYSCILLGIVILIFIVSLAGVKKSGNEIGSPAESLRFMLKSLLERFKLQENMRYYNAIISSVDTGGNIKDDAGVVRECNVGAKNIPGFMAEESAENKAKRLAAIISVADAGIIVKDIDCNILEWNIGAENILGYKPEEIIGKNTKYYVPEEHHAEIDDIKKRLLRGEHTTHVEVVRKHKDGRLIDCSATYTPFFNENGEYTGSVTVFQDISYKKQIEYALTEAVRTAEDASKAKSIFLANMSHEIRTPMNGIIGLAELALDETDVSENIKDYLFKIKISADSLLKIINDILDISKIEAGAMKLEMIPFDLHDIFLDCEAVSSLKAVEKGIALHFYAEPIIGKKLLGDPTKLRQVFINLLSNAIKFTNHGIVKLMAIAEEQKDDRVKIRIEVRDSGIGMTQKQIESIFKPFVQADNSTTRKYGGTGLGLSITKNIIEMMGGKLEVESTPGIGSKFVFTLSFDTVSQSKNEHRNYISSDIITKPVFVGEVLVCEDNSINRDVIKKHLARVGLTSVIAANGEQGLSAVKERMQNGNPFDLILMDIHMPVMDGLQAMQKLLEIGNKTPVVALTANAMITDKDKYLEHGMSDYLSKPFTTQKLWACLMKYLTPVDFIQSSDKVNPNDGFLHTDDGRPLIISDVLNEKAGIENSSGDGQFYKHIQQDFYKDNMGTAQRLKEALDSGDMISAHRIAHTLKSAAGLIGAEKLVQAARNAELALSEESPGFSVSQMENLETELRDVLTILKPFSEENDSKTERASESLDMDGAAVLVAQLTPLLKCGDPESVEFTNRIRTILSPLEDVCDNLVNQIEDYDFDAAYETVCGIKLLLNEMNKI